MFLTGALGIKHQVFQVSKISHEVYRGTLVNRTNHSTNEGSLEITPTVKILNNGERIPEKSQPIMAGAASMFNFLSTRVIPLIGICTQPYSKIKNKNEIIFINEGQSSNA